MKTVFVGGGILAERLKACAPGGVSIEGFGIREAQEPARWSKLADAASNADLIVYPAYHHTDLKANIVTLRRLVRVLADRGWKGKLVFFNTQAAIRGAMKGSGRAPVLLACDLYSFTKKLQSWLLRNSGQSLDICDLYLPVVVGHGTKAQDRFRFIGSHRIVEMPNKGQNQFAYLDVQVFAGWFWQRFGASDVVHSGRRFERLFIYQGIKTFSSMFGSFTQERGALDDCRHRFRFGPGMRGSLVWALRLSPLGLIASALKGIFVRRLSGTPASAPVAPGKRFVPTGPEYQFYGMSLDADAIPFEKLKIG
jgi:hypothetical protein